MRTAAENGLLSDQTQNETRLDVRDRAAARRSPVLADALAAVERLRPLAEKVRRRDRSLADQLRRAASSVVLNLGEALYSDAGNRLARLHTTAGSANEARVALELAIAWGYLAPDEILAADDKLDAVLARTYRLTHWR